ncbi:hypothetical protein BN1013_01167 [Candidatus Rubidus massiliensis]|nr:hypothetical protein BN1013_01167 [Candidatus Rubidus massiliensis]
MENYSFAKYSMQRRSLISLYRYTLKRFCLIFLALTFFKAYSEERRALPAPFLSPPFPTSEYQGSPLIGVPVNDTIYPLMKNLSNSSLCLNFKQCKIKAYGWLNVSGNISNCTHSNAPESYWIVPNRLEMDQFVFRLEKEVNTLPLNECDIGFRSSFMYGMDYRFVNAGGWTSSQLIKHNSLYGYDFTEQYVDFYTPYIAKGTIFRIGRWVSCPDIETQFAPDNYLGSHSLLFFFDTYTQTGILITSMLNQNWTIQAALHSGTDMAPWYKGAVPTGMFGIRWVSSTNNDSLYLVLNSINSAHYRRFKMYGKKLGRDNYNYLVGTWQHKFSENRHTKTESYIMWQRDAAVGGTAIVGPKRSFGGGDGLGPKIKGLTLTYGILNYLVQKISDKAFFAIRNEIVRDNFGERSGYSGTYTSHTLGLTYNFTKIFQVRPEVSFYRNWNRKAFDLGKKRNLFFIGFDTIIRF